MKIHSQQQQQIHCILLIDIYNFSKNKRKKHHQKIIFYIFVIHSGHTLTYAEATLLLSQISFIAFGSM